MRHRVRNRLWAAAQHLRRDQSGAISLFSLQIFVIALLLGGLAVDLSNALAGRAQLQATADAAAHAALYTREFGSADRAREAALTITEASMPRAHYGQVLTPDDIQFGHWDRAGDVFRIDALSREAVFVSTRRYSEQKNGLGTFFLRLIGLDSWDLTTGAVFETWRPACLHEGFVARGRVILQSGGLYRSGVCIHSNAFISLGSNNFFEPGTILSMPDKREVATTAGVVEATPGLGEALRDASYRLRVVNRIDLIAKEILNKDSPFWRDYITIKDPLLLGPEADMGPGTFMAGTIYLITCTDPDQRFDLNNDTVLLETVLVTNCRVAISAGTTIEDATIITTNRSPKALSAASDIIIGKMDSCEEGGDVQILVAGGINFASNVRIFGGQVVAGGNLSMSAEEDSILGASVQAGGQMNLALKGSVGSCAGKGMGRMFEFNYFRLAR